MQTGPVSPWGVLPTGIPQRNPHNSWQTSFLLSTLGSKAFSDDFYKKYVGVPSVEPVLRNIRDLARRCHVEVAFPVIENVNDRDLPEVASFISEIRRDIPWHVFRLLPEHQMKTAAYPNIERISEVLASCKDHHLDYIYFHNFVGSEWVNTLCPSCGAVAVKRFSLGCSGDQLDQFLARDNACPACGTKIAMLGDQGGLGRRTGTWCLNEKSPTCGVAAQIYQII